MRACTPWVLLCVLVILILILAALLINNLTGTAAVAAIGGAALSKKRKRAKEIFGGDVKDFWDVETDKVRTAVEETFTRPPADKPFFPELQTANNPKLVPQWVAIRNAFKKLSDDLDKAWKADPAKAAWKGAARAMKIDRTMARGVTTRTLGTWRYAYDAFDGVLIQLGDLVDLYQKDSPSIADITTTFPAIKGYLTTYFDTIRTQMYPTKPEQAAVVASVDVLAPLISALPPPFNYAATYPLPASSVTLPADFMDKDIGDHGSIALSTVINLYNAYTNARNMWASKRVEILEILRIRARDEIFGNCDGYVSDIMKCFVDGSSTEDTANRCHVVKLSLIKTVEQLLGLFEKSEKRLISLLLDAAKKLAHCLPPIPNFATTYPNMTMFVQAARGKTPEDKTALAKSKLLVKDPSHGSHATDYPYQSLQNLNVNYYNLTYDWYRDRAAPEKIVLQQALEVDRIIKRFGTLIDTQVDDSYFKSKAPLEDGWPTTVTDQCANAVNELRSLSEGLDSTPGIGDWGKFKRSVIALGPIKPAGFKGPPIPTDLAPKLNTLLVSKQYPTDMINNILYLAQVLSTVNNNYRTAVIGKKKTPLRNGYLRHRGVLTAIDSRLANIYGNTIALINMCTADVPTDLEAVISAATSVLDDIGRFQTEMRISPVPYLNGILPLLTVDADKILLPITVNPIVTPLKQLLVYKSKQLLVYKSKQLLVYKSYESSVSQDTQGRPLTASQRLIHLTFTPDVKANFVKEVPPDAHGTLVLEASSIEELDAKLARTPRSNNASIFGLVVDKPGDLVALYKAVAINIKRGISDELKTKQANVANAATGRLYKTTWMPNLGGSGGGAYYKEFIDHIKPALYAVT